MRKLLVLIACFALSFNGFSQSAPDLKAVLEQIMQGVSNGSVNTSNWSLEGLGGVNASDFDKSVLPGGRDNLDFSKGSPLGNMFGGMFGNIFGNKLMGALGVEEIYNTFLKHKNSIFALKV